MTIFIIMLLSLLYISCDHLVNINIIDTITIKTSTMITIMELIK